MFLNDHSSLYLVQIRLEGQSKYKIIRTQETSSFIKTNIEFMQTTNSALDIFSTLEPICSCAAPYANTYSLRTVYCSFRQ